MPRSIALTAVAAFFAVLTAGLLPAAEHDGNVEWFGVFSYRGFPEPQFPRQDREFSVGVRAFRGDLTAARVHMDDGTVRVFDMAIDRSEGPFDYWRGTVEATSSKYLRFYFELIDGGDSDFYNALGMWNDPPGRGDYTFDLGMFGRYPLGATFLSSGAVFRVWAPNATAVAVSGDFNDWSSTTDFLEWNSRIDTWSGFVQGAVPGSEYRFILSGDISRTDPRGRAMTSSVGNSIVVDEDAHEWGDQDWETPFFQDMILYELHVGTFSGGGDGLSHYPGTFRDVVDTHLDHLVELGINMIELMPVNEFSGGVAWGYNPSSLYAIEQAYGGPEGLKYLVDSCHQRGIGVLIDVVYNHMGASDLSGNILEYDGEEIYFYPEGNGFRETPWGPRLDYGIKEVKEFLLDNIRYWLEEYHMDGFRLDGTAFVDINADGWELLKDISRVVDTVSLKAIVTAEHLPNNPAVTTPIESGGAGLDSQWNDLFHDNLRQAIRDAALGDPNMASIADGINQFSVGTGNRLINYIESHDEVAVQGRVTEEADSSNPESEWAQGRAKVAAALVFFSAGIPMILQGQEFLESRRFGDEPQHRIQWQNREVHAPFFEYMKDVIALRRTRPALRSASSQNVFHVNDGANVLAFQRQAGRAEDDLVIVVSLNNNNFGEYRLGFPRAGTWVELLNGDAAVYNGSNVGNLGHIVADGPGMHGMPHSATIVLPRMGVLVFGRAPSVGFIRGDCDNSGEVDFTDAIRGLEFLLLGGESLDCTAACDANFDRGFDFTDAIDTLKFIFLGTEPPPLPWPECGGGEVPDGLECSRSCS